MARKKAGVKIAASLLSADFGCLREEVAAVEKAGVDMLHLDVMDGSFVPNISFGPMVVEAVDRLTKLPLYVHLMIQRPDLYAEAFAASGADVIVIHYEARTHLESTLKLIHDLGCQAGLSVNPNTPITVVEPFYGQLDHILVMSVNPGFGAQKFLSSANEKIKKLRLSLDQQELKELQIAVDGGINPETAKAVREGGAQILVAGSAIFHSSDYGRVVRLLRGDVEGKPCSRS